MKRWKKVLIGIVLFLFLLITGIGVLIGTTPGLHLLLNGAARWVPGLQIQQVTGGWRDLTLRGVSYQMPGIKVTGDSLHLAINTRCLWHTSLCVNDISLDGINLVVDSSKLPTSPAKSESETESRGEISTPYPIWLRQLQVNNVSVQVDNTRIYLGHFATGLNWQQRHLQLLPTRIQDLLVTLPTPQQIAIDETKQAVAKKITQSTAEQQVQAAAKVQQQRAQAAQTTVQLPLGERLKTLFSQPLLTLPEFRLPLDFNIDEVLGENLRVTGATELNIKRVQFKATAKDNQVTLETLNLNADQGQLFASGHADLSGLWPVDLVLNSSLNTAPLKGEKAHFKLTGNLMQQVDLALNLSGPVKAQLQAMAQPAVSGLPMALSLKSPELRWPLTGKAQIQAKPINLSLSGKAIDYRLQGHTALTGSSLPATVIHLSGDGNIEQFNLDKLQLELLEGTVNLKALVDWSQAMSWRSQLAINGINTRKLSSDWPVRLDGNLVTRGSFYGESWQVSVPTLDFTGKVKQNPLRVKGELRGNSYNQWTIPGINLVLGSNQLAITGSLAEQIKLDAKIDAPHLDNALPGLGGVVQGAILARGSLKQPELQMDINGRGIRWQELRLAAVKLQGKVTSAEQIQGNLLLSLRQLQQPGLDIRQIQLAGQGNEQKHQLTLDIEGKPLAGQFALNGSFNRQTQRWQGSLSHTHFSTPVGEVRLGRSVSLDYQNLKQTITIGSHCWLNPNAEICIPEPIVAGPDGRARVQLRRFDLAMIQNFLPEGTKLQGRFSGDARVNWTAVGGLPTGNLSLSGQGVKIEQDMQGNTLPISFNRLDLHAALTNGKAQLQWLIGLLNNGQLSGNVQVADPQRRRGLSGTINIERLSLDLINPALMRGEQVQGIVTSHLRLGGNLQQPQVFGQTSLHGVKAIASQLPIELTSADIDMLFNGMSSTLKGRIQTRQGHLDLAGGADWRQLDNWRAKITAQGDRIRVTVPPMVRLDVSPKLALEATPTALNLDGLVVVPWARILVQEVPESAVGVSSDEVMLDENLRPIQPKTAGMAINSNLIVHLGNDVQLSAFGLKARLDGDLKVGQDKSGLGLNGQINIPEGRFHAYGQDLLVRKGQLQFSGPPSQPYINMEAIRNPEATEDDVTAGIRVTGLADEPKVEIFSDPAMSQQEALSYLLRGQGLGGDGDGNALTSALVGLGVAQSGQMVGKIGETFGISDLALDTAGVGDSQQVQVSGYVLPGLQVKYGVGLFDSLATLTLRYRLMPKLYLEAVSGVDQALDLLYQFQFN